jgi:hypothetical protein
MPVCLESFEQPVAGLDQPFLLLGQFRRLEVRVLHVNDKKCNHVGTFPS